MQIIFEIKNMTKTDNDAEVLLLFTRKKLFFSSLSSVGYLDRRFLRNISRAELFSIFYIYLTREGVLS